MRWFIIRIDIVLFRLLFLPAPANCYWIRSSELKNYVKATYPVQLQADRNQCATNILAQERWDLFRATKAISAQKISYQSADMAEIAIHSPPGGVINNPV